LPIAALVREGVELGEADDRVFGRKGSKEGDGIVGLLTGGVVDRANYYSQAIVLAMIPFLKHRELF
jgi:non-canonical (house-cleaning) NTP pyrophosphatase